MNYSKGKWEVYKDFVIDDKGNSIHIPNTKRKFSENLANAHLIAAAVNACISVNPDNPQAVAESIKDMYEALEDIIQQAEKTLFVGADLADSIKIFGKQALANSKT